MRPSLSRPRQPEPTVRFLRGPKPPGTEGTHGMRRIVAASALAMLFGSSPARAGASFRGPDPPQLQRQSASIDTANRVRYSFAATSQGIAFTGEGVWDPV